MLKISRKPELLGKRVACLVAVVSLLAVTAFADDITWVGGGTDQYWDNPDNWSTGNVPTANDDVTIPSGSPNCHLPEGDVHANSLTNDGTIQGGNSRIVAEGDIENNGEMSGGSYSSFSLFSKGDNAWITNNGTIDGSQVNLNAVKGNVFNASGATIQGNESSSNIGVAIFAGNQVSNNGTIKGNDGDYPDGPGQNVSIMGDDVLNMGIIKGGNGGMGERGGDVSINAWNFFNNRGKIVAGNGDQSGGEGGEVHIWAKNLNNNGGTEAGYSNGGWKASNDDPFPANVYFIGDSIEIHPGDSLITAGFLYITGRKMLFYDINGFAGVIGDSAIKINTSAGGTADFSGTHTNGAVFSPFGTIFIASDNIIPPAEGLDYICEPDPTVSGSDTTIVGGGISDGFASGEAWDADSFTVSMQNQSTTAKGLKYSVSSVLGWVSSFSDSTALLEPFEFANFYVPYSIPASITETTTDTVTMILTIAGKSFADTGYAYITGYPSVGIEEEEEVIAKNATLSVYPNPFATGVRVQGLGVSEGQESILQIYDLSGRLVRRTNNGIWNGRDLSGKEVQSGIYFLKVEGYKPVKVVKLR